MTQVSLLDSNRLSGLLGDALSWNDSVTSILVAARNGSILAYAFKYSTPSIKAMRTKSTTITAAYTAAAESTLVFESQDTGAINVIVPVGDHVLLAVSGAEPKNVEQPNVPLFSPRRPSESDDQVDVESENSDDADHTRMREELELTTQELSSILKEELSGMKWPGDI